jgi:RNA-splicing ligase RtcB
VQVVDEIADENVASRWNLAVGQVLIMYHLGPGPLGSILSNLYAFRSKPQLHRKVGYAFFRNVLHLRNGRGYHRTFAAFNQWLTLDSESEQGMAYANVLNVIKNYGFAYRTATMRAIVDAVHEVTGSPPDSNELIVDMSHNMLQPEEISNQRFWVSRHNCCRPRPGMPGIVAGNHQVSSYVTIGPPDCDSVLAGYDHGVGFLIEEAQQKGLLGNDPSGHEVRRLSMTRGTQQLHEQEVLPLMARTPLDSAMRTLAADGMARPVALLRPLATLKHRT